MMRNRKEKRLARTVALRRVLHQGNRRMIRMLMNGDDSHHLPKFFGHGVRTPMGHFIDPGFLPAPTGGQIDLVQDMTCGLIGLPICVGDVGCVHRHVRTDNTSEIVGFCRLLAKLACFLFHPSIPRVYVKRRCLFLRGDFRFPGTSGMDLTLLGFFAMLADLKTGRHLTLSFHCVGSSPRGGVHIVPPLLHGRIALRRPCSNSCVRNCVIGTNFDRGMVG